MNITNILMWIIFGGLAGWVASIIVGGEENLGIIGNIITGVIGAFVGGWIADRIGASKTPGTERPSTLIDFVWAVVGAVVLLLVINFFF